MALEAITGELSKFRFKVVGARPAKPLTRPADMSTDPVPAGVHILPELTTSTITAQVATNSIPTPKMYGTPKAGESMTWAEPKPGEASWSGSLSGLVLPTEPERAAMIALQNALGQYVWIERALDGDTTPEGGYVIITSRGMPVPVEGNVTFDVGFTGYGPNFLDVTNIA
ncbi:hypothetical protein [Deinococcus daejeonensis]|uniref:Uncharacterized protein n=1 Tax=Deinococcus daejeonensis TaxID=1007098 RepID=A0ABQ2IWK9_9DEIO|nr:hypothetical protein [Deinococcus daejeonensis]GGN32262.1 hypothetical protein GCM10010842_08790 [Deinococcus daejeonensis]